MIRVAFLLFLLSMVQVSQAAPQVDPESENAIRTRIAKRFPGTSAEDVKLSPVKGLYEVMVGPMVLYVSADGRYVVKGDVYDMETDRNLTASRIAVARSRSLDQLGDDQLIVFGDADAKHTVTVFTDVTCGYCRTLHSEIDEYLERGIRVRYAAFPRSGMASEAWRTMERVWCAEDRHEALTRAKRDREFESPASCETRQVMEQWQLGRMLGVRGTPAIFTQTGEMIPGYLPPAELLRRLEMLRREK